MADRLVLQFAPLPPALILQWATPGGPLPPLPPIAALPTVPVVIGPPGPAGPPGSGAEDPGDLTLIFNNKLI